MDIWRDATSYSQSDKIREPRIYEIQLPGDGRRRRIVVHRLHMCSGWFTTFEPLYAGREAGNDLDEAKRFAIRSALEAVDALVQSVEFLRNGGA